MASKRQASSSKQPDSREKKLKVEGEDDTWTSTLATLKTAPKEKLPTTIDGLCPLSSALGVRLYEGYDWTLNQTDISANSNKFYIIQLLEHDGAYSVWSRWGHVTACPGHVAPVPAVNVSVTATRLEELSSRFYTIVPHNFGRARPPTINSPDLMHAKKDMLLVLADIEVAQSLQAQKENVSELQRMSKICCPAWAWRISSIHPEDKCLPSL